jgi:hypothetical protein
VRFLDGRLEGRECDDDFRLRRRERFLHLARGVNRILRRDDSADLPDRELGDKELRTVWKDERDTVATLDAGFLERLREGVAPLVELAEGVGRRFEGDRDRIGSCCPCSATKSTSVFSGYWPMRAGTSGS